MSPKLKTFLVVVGVVIGFLLVAKFLDLVGLNKPHTLTEADGLILILGLLFIHDSLKDRLQDVKERLERIEDKLEKR
jgi:hypothetical protein